MPPLSDTDVVVWLAVPPQVVAAVAATVVRPAGKLSVRVAAVRAPAEGFESVIVSVEATPGLTGFGANALATVGMTGVNWMGVATLLFPGFPSPSGSGLVPFCEASLTLVPVTAPVPLPFAELL